MACFTALSSSCPRRRYTISSFIQTVGGSVARSPEQITSSDSSFCRFFPRMVTTSVAVQDPKASRTNSIGPGALFEVRSESMVIACPDGPVATNFCSPIHFTDPVCMRPPQRKHSRARRLKRVARILLAFDSFFTLNCAARPIVSVGLGEGGQMQIPVSIAQRLLTVAVLG